MKITIKTYIKIIIKAIEDILFLWREKRYTNNCIIFIEYRNYLPRSLNRKLIIRSLIAQNYLPENAEKMADAFLDDKAFDNDTDCFFKNPFIRFFVSTTHGFPAMSAQRYLELREEAKKNPPKLIVAEGNTREEQLEDIRRKFNKLNEQEQQKDEPKSE